uniref:Guanylate cyclase activator 1C n=1 Tax=Hucho hucho TaxID=62062 RepID=A0A4W5L242_9TELE
SGNSSNLDDILAEDMHHWYNKFMKESPSGLITLFELKTMLEMQGMSEEASSYVDQVFFTFDMDGDGYIDFVEYIAAVSLMLKGEINQKLKWYFKLFDQDGNGKIDQDEMGTIFKVGFYIYLLFCHLVAETFPTRVFFKANRLAKIVECYKNT